MMTLEERAMRAHDDCDHSHGICYDCCLKALRAVRLEALATAANAMCRFCAMGWKVEEEAGWGLYHFNADGGPDQKCEAAAIRAIAAGEPDTPPTT